MYLLYAVDEATRLKTLYQTLHSSHIHICQLNCNFAINCRLILQSTLKCFIYIYIFGFNKKNSDNINIMIKYYELMMSEVNVSYMLINHITLLNHMVYHLINGRHVTPITQKILPQPNIISYLNTYKQQWACFLVSIYICSRNKNCICSVTCYKSLALTYEGSMECKIYSTLFYSKLEILHFDTEISAFLLTVI